jgi:hypothetical protein
MNGWNRGTVAVIRPSSKRWWAIPDAQVAERERRFARGLAGREGPRTRFWTTTPPACLLAAVASTALRIGDAQDEQTAATILEPIFEAAQRARPREYQQASQWFPFPDDLAQIWRRFSHPRSSQAALRARRDAREHPVAYELKHVPRALPDELFLPALKPLMVGMYDETARTYAALCLARLAGADSWRAAGRAIGLEPWLARSIPSSASSKLNRAGTKEAFWDEIQQIASAFASTGLVDYSARRRRFGSFDLIPVAEWEAIRREGGVAEGRDDIRRRYASVWLWAVLTGEPWRLARVYRGKPSRSQRTLFNRFTKELLPALRAPLLRYAERLVAEE